MKSLMIGIMVVCVVIAFLFLSGFVGIDKNGFCLSECRLGDTICLSENQTARCIPYNSSCYRWVPYQTCGKGTKCSNGKCMITVKTK